MTPQEIITKVWEHMAKQREQSRDESKGCLYRGPNGTACAVGCLLDDATARELDTLEDPDIETITSNHSDLVPEWVEDNWELLAKLQDAHDIKTPLGQDWYTEFKARVQAIALSYGCEVPG